MMGRNNPQRGLFYQSSYKVFLPISVALDPEE